MIIVVMVVIGGCYAAFEIVRDRYPEEFNEFVKDAKRIREHVGKHALKRTKPTSKVKARQRHITKKK